MQNENQKKRFAGRGYYIALIACIAAVGISGYVFVKTARDSALEPMETVAAPAQSQQAAASVATPAVTPSPSPSAGRRTSASNAGTTSETAETFAQTQETLRQDPMEDAYKEDPGAEYVMVFWPVQGAVTATLKSSLIAEKASCHCSPFLS